jgi:hypothetical protein
LRKINKKHRRLAFVGKRIALALPMLLTALLLASCNYEQEPQRLEWGHEGEYRGFRYILSEAYGGSIEITGWTGSGRDVVFPAAIKTLPVVFIQGRERSAPFEFFDSPFEGRSLSSVALPNTLAHIDWGAFANNELAELRLPNNLFWIGEGAFMNNRLAAIDIPDSVRFIRPQAFENNLIADIRIGNGVSRIQYAAFRNNKIAGLAIPANVVFIEAQAFANNEIEELHLTEGLGIGGAAFANNRLVQLHIPARAVIWNEAFLGNNITRVSVGENVSLYPVDGFPVFELGFDDAFLANGGRAGLYEYENGRWRFTPPDDIDIEDEQ